MTKFRPPLTFFRALTEIAGKIDWDVAAEIIGKAERTIRNWSDPDTEAGVTLEAALRLDAAYVAAGGDHAPLLLVYQTRIGLEISEAVADLTQLAERVGEAARESGEAVEALIRATHRRRSRADRAIAKREVDQAIEAFARTIPCLETESLEP